MPESVRELLAAASETRCECGQLIAKVRVQGLELKCKRCKRIVVIPFSSIEGWSTVQSSAHR
jgi:phage FluMu protein Com